MTARPVVLVQVPVQVQVVVLAAGRGTRFAASGGQGDKLAALLDGKPVLQHVLDAVAAAGLPCHVQREPAASMAASIARGVAATPGAAGWMVLPGDLPRIRPATLRAAADAFAGSPHNALRVVHGGQRAHPVVFPADCAAALHAVAGQAQGGAQRLLDTLRAAGRLRELEVDDPGTVQDIDTVQALAALASRAAIENVAARAA